MKKDDMIGAIAMRLKILHLQDFNSFMSNELPLPYLLDKLAETALETVEIEGMMPPLNYNEETDMILSEWEGEDEPT
jgi:hypothetical protein